MWIIYICSITSLVNKSFLLFLGKSIYPCFLSIYLKLLNLKYLVKLFKQFVIYLSCYKLIKNNRINNIHLTFRRVEIKLLYYYVFLSFSIPKFHPINQPNQKQSNYLNSNFLIIKVSKIDLNWWKIRVFIRIKFINVFAFSSFNLTNSLFKILL